MTKEEESYSDEFIQHQIDYYAKHLGSGNFFDRCAISGYLHYFEGLQNARKRRLDNQAKETS
jgi:superfamily I DNA/RNA helicase